VALWPFVPLALALAQPVPGPSTPAAPASSAAPAIPPAPDPAAPVAPASLATVDAPAPPAILSRIAISGKLLASDSTQSLLQYLDVKLPGPWDEQTQARVQSDLEAVGYRASFEVAPIVPDAVEASGGAPRGGSELRIVLQPMRVVRRIDASGNWPIFAWEVLSYMSWRTGYRLPEGPALYAEIRKQEQELESFLHRTGYYDATASIVLDWAPDAPEQVDVHVRIKLNVGFFRLKYTIGNIRAEGFHLLSHSQLAGFFEHCCLWLGRTSTERIKEDFNRIIDYYQSKGYVGVRLVKRDILPDHARRQVDLDLAIEERRRVSLRFVGRKRISEKELLKHDVITIFRDNYASANELDESARNIFRLYQAQGFFDARVSWRWLDRSSDPMKVEFDIYEGPQLKVRDIDFQAAVVLAEQARRADHHPPLPAAWRHRAWRRRLRVGSAA
jgi:outer membrane protein assembly factor BamA